MMAELPRSHAPTSGFGDDSDLRRRITLVELVDRVFNKGVVLSGDLTLSVAGVDLVYVGLRLLISSVAALEEAREA